MARPKGTVRCSRHTEAAGRIGQARQASNGKQGTHSPMGLVVMGEGGHRPQGKICGLRWLRPGNVSLLIERGFLGRRVAVQPSQWPQT